MTQLSYIPDVNYVGRIHLWFEDGEQISNFLDCPGRSVNAATYLATTTLIGDGHLTGTSAVVFDLSAFSEDEAQTSAELLLLLIGGSRAADGRIPFR